MPYKYKADQLEQQAQYRISHRLELREANRRYEISHKQEIRNRTLLRRYGITVQQKEAMWVKQRGKCALCKLAMQKQSKGNFAVHIDHDHLTGKVRALLHHRCNIRLGVIEDEQFLELALAYLREHNGAIT